MRARAALAFALLPALAGCAVTDPLTQEGLWHPTGANEANLRLMVAAPSDLARGVAARGADGHGAARAVDRLRRGRVKPLPDVGIATSAPAGAVAAPAAANASGDE